jgi:O-methyltransferase domain/Dimerisation domain
VSAPSAELRRLINGYQVSQAIHVAAVLGIADLLAGGPRSSDDLAAAAGADPDALYRLLRALAAVDVLHEADGRRFSLTELGDGLRSDAEAPVGGWAAFIGRPSYWQTWGALLHSVRAGENAFKHVNGTDPWTFRAAHPDEAAAFDRAMADLTRRSHASVMAAYDFSRFGTIVDVGGGNGAFLASVLAEHPDQRGILLDLPHAVAGAPDIDRLEAVAGDFFESVPKGGDAYVLRAVLHDWEDDEAAAILTTCRRAMGPGATLVIIERDLGPPNALPETKLSDLNMLVAPGGRERSIAEYGDLLARAGLTLAESHEAGYGLHVILAA